MSLDAAWALRWIELAAADVAEQRDYLVDLDRAIGDGDHGENMDRGFRAAVEALSEAQPGSVAEVLKTVAKTLMSTVGGAAGPLYGTAFLRASKAAGGGDLDGVGVAAVIEGALSGIQARGKATTGEKTMVDAWTPALETARAVAEAGGDAGVVLEAAATAAEAGAAATEPLRATKGRASYLGERSIGHLDPGAVSTSLILRAAVRARRMHKDAAFLKSVLVPGGSVPAEEICQVLAQDEPFAPLFANTALFAAAQAGAEIRFVTNDLTLSDGMRMFAPTGSAEESNTGLCVLAAHEKYDILITGDLSQNEEYRLLSQNELRGIELLVAGHHGAATSTSDALLAQTGARTVILSVGADNSYGHPAAQTLARIQNAGAAIYRTDEMGTIVIRGGN